MPQQDTIFIRELKTNAIIGVHDWEQRSKQPIIVDLELTCDITTAAQSDNLDLTVDYTSACEAILALIDNSKFKLIESLATAIAALLLQDPKLHHVKVTVQKPTAVPQATSVGVCIERSNRT